MPYRGRPWLNEQLDRLHAAGIPDCYVVLGFNHTAYLPLLDARFRATACMHSRIATQLHLVHNPTPERGPFSSLCAAIPRLAESAAAAFVLPLDVPAATPETWRTLAASMHDGLAAVIPTHAERGGHPVLLRCTLLQHLLTIPHDSPDARLDHQLRQLPPAHIMRVPVDDPQVINNLNTPTDWGRICHP